MSKIRILGPRERLDDVLAALQDVGTLHIAPPTAAAVVPIVLDARKERHRRVLRHALEDLEAAIEALGPPPRMPVTAAGAIDLGSLARGARLGRRIRRTVERLERRRIELEEERALIEKYRHYLTFFETLLRSQARWPNAVAYHLVLRAQEAATVERLRSSLAAAIGEGFELRARRMPTSEIALLLVVAADAARRVDRVLAEAHVLQIPVPASFGGRSLAEALPRMIERLERIPGELAAVRAEREALARSRGVEVRGARAAVSDRLGQLDALARSGATRRAFVLEGWLPSALLPKLRERVQRVADTLAVEELSAEGWTATAPVVLTNPRFFRPFEAIVRLLPLPRYGSIDPTPFVAVFFPMFFGLILGDVGYGAGLAALGLVLHARTEPGTTLRDVAEISGPCAAFSILFGLAYGEFFGDLGRRWFGLRPLVFDREESVIPFLLLAVSIGVVHVMLGLALGVVNAWRDHPRHALGRGLAALMIGLIVVALLAAFRVLPASFFTPTVILLLVAFPTLVALEGLVAAIEFLSVLGNVLSYARIMALGTASVMLAVVANRMAGAIGSALVGVVFALLFHLVNFALGIFSPTIHALRLHYVEFFGKFYSPGGTAYRPLAHWKPGMNHAG